MRLSRARNKTKSTNDGSEFVVFEFPVRLCFAALNYGRQRTGAAQRRLGGNRHNRGEFARTLPAHTTGRHHLWLWSCYDHRPRRGQRCCSVCQHSRIPNSPRPRPWQQPGVWPLQRSARCVHEGQVPLLLGIHHATGTLRMSLAISPNT